LLLLLLGIVTERHAESSFHNVFVTATSGPWPPEELPWQLVEVGARATHPGNWPIVTVSHVTKAPAVIQRDVTYSSSIVSPLEADLMTDR